MMDARITPPNNELNITFEAHGKNMDSPNGSISVKTISNCAHVSDELRMLETITYSYFMHAFKKIVPKDRADVINQYIERLSKHLPEALDA